MKQHFLLFWVLTVFFFACGTTSDGGKDHQYTNHLVNESSPYLLQHAHNPVDWYPWGEEALQKAKEEDKMLIISVGYSACHWCHVMEHESFEDTLVARIMNENFINIKVDREERPDVDNIYMTACHLSTGRGCGWPLNAFALPDGRPVWAGTYFPKKEWLDVLEYWIETKENKPEELDAYATQITEGIQSSEDLVATATGEVNYQEEDLEAVVANFIPQIDMARGGRRGSPKFPVPTTFEFLLKYHHYSQNELALQAVTSTLDNMAMGGIYDHLGGGFARYSTDAEWKVPHFEKMLYDNGQLVSMYAHAYQATQNPLYKQVIEETITFVERELSDENGGFYSSLDADSEGEEGKFYVWTKAELDALITDPKTNAVFTDYFQIKEKGNWEEEKNILYWRKPLERIAEKHDLTVDEAVSLLQEVKEKLFKERNKRVRPGLDDKMLTAWNGLMLQGYVDAYKALGVEAYRDRAIKNGQFIKEQMMQDDYRLNRNFKDGKSVINAFLDDYAWTIHAFIGLYEITFDEQWLGDARSLLDYAMTHFNDSESPLLYYTSDLDPPLVARKKEVADNVIPGSNSAMARNAYRLGLYYYNSDYLDKAKAMMHQMWSTISEQDQPSFYSNWCSHYLDLLTPPYEVAVVGPEAADKTAVLSKAYLPNAILLGGEEEGELELLKGKLQEGATLIYVCQNKVCKLPVEDPVLALQQINE